MLDKLRIGFGFDIHQLEIGKEFFIGGIHIESSFGATGHSDADVLLHAICDALLGAANLGDIGTNFPDTDSKWKGIRSIKLLSLTNELITKHGFSIINIDSTICLEEPKISSKRIQMQQEIAKILSIEPSKISIKATTNEKLGFIGRKEGVSAYACALIYSN